MTFTCPHCQKENKVAGWLGFAFTQDGREQSSTLTCGHCLKQVTESQLKAAAQQPPKGIQVMNDQEVFEIWDKARRCLFSEAPIEITAKQLEELSRDSLNYRAMLHRMEKIPQNESQQRKHQIQSELVQPAIQ